MTAQEGIRRMDEWVEKHYPETMYKKHEIAIAQHAYLSGLFNEEE